MSKPPVFVFSIHLGQIMFINICKHLCVSYFSYLYSEKIQMATIKSLREDKCLTVVQETSTVKIHLHSVRFTTIHTHSSHSLPYDYHINGSCGQKRNNTLSTQRESSLWANSTPIQISEHTIAKP